jgi:protein arginine kinase
MELQVMAKSKSGWLTGKGPEADVVFSSRVRLARNLSKIPFPAWADQESRKKVLEEVRKGTKKIKALKNAQIFYLRQLDEIDCQLLMERHLVSAEYARGKWERALIVDDQERLAIMINEEDHIRLQTLEAGLSLKSVWEKANFIDEQLEKNCSYAFSPRLGYLTACPTNTGTGLRASCLIYLPALIYTKEINNLLQNLSKIGIVARGFYGEGTKVMGDFIQVSNATTLGKSEEEIIDNLIRVVKQIIGYERKRRENLMKGEARTKIEDTSYRALGTLSFARAISYQEAIELLSQVRLGIYLGFDLPAKLGSVNELLFLTQPAHIQEIAGKKLSPGERDVFRAQFIQKYLKKEM